MKAFSGQTLESTSFNLALPLNQRLPLLLSFGFSCATTLADIAPTQFIGSGITPVEETDIRMESAEVTIVWGSPCTLTASFTMINESLEPRSVSVGFPMPIAKHFRRSTNQLDRLTISFDGQGAAVNGPFEGESDSWSCLWHWYRCTHEFAPGKTRVEVASRLQASGVYATGYTESLHYCLRTGGQWAGPIGAERVSVRFPFPVAAEQIVSIRPNGYRIEGAEIRWDFSDIEPKDDTLDIHVTYVRPDAMQVIRRLRQELDQHPESATAGVALAKHLLALGSGRSNSGYLPQRLTSEQYEKLMADIESKADLAIFTRHYRSNYSGGYRAVSQKLVGEAKALPRILADAGYRDATSRSAFIQEGEKLLMDALSQDPRNAEFWNVYLANYWRFSFGAVGHPFGPTRFGKGQVRAIQRAVEHCPEDATIQLWLELYRKGITDDELKQLQASIKTHGYRKVDFP